MSTNFEDVQAFYRKFEIPHACDPSLLGPATYEFRLNRLHEELAEFATAHQNKDLMGCADALVDLVYIAMGTAINMGLPWQELWDEVQRANMTKARALHPGESKHNTTLDVIKPRGWRGPDHRLALNIAPFDHIKVDVDGNAAFALVGENLQDGESEFVVIDNAFRERWMGLREDGIRCAAMAEARTRLEERLGQRYKLKGED